MKRAYCLYRVFTVGQVDQNNIPMQRQACHTFAKEKGWQIIKEFSEKGVSGYKRSVDQREIAHALIARIELWRGGAIKIEWSYGGATHVSAKESGYAGG